jgi:environmental stress-induced protein Ves
MSRSTQAPAAVRPAPRLVAADAVAPQPWRNGGGRTRELLAWPSGQDWQLRISVADIEANGPFSAFDGVQRWFAVLEGHGVVLGFGSDERRVLREDPPLHFDGARAPGCRLVDGPTRDLNLMLRRASGTMLAARRGTSWQPDARACGFFAAVAGELGCAGDAWRLGPRTLAWFAQSPAAALAFRTDVSVQGTIGWFLSFTPHAPHDA